MCDWLNKLWYIYTMEYLLSNKKKVSLHNTWMNSRQLCWMKRAKRLHIILILFIYFWNDKIIEMGNRLRFPEVERNGAGVGEGERSVCYYKRVTKGILAVKELFCILSISMSTLALVLCTKVLQKVIIWGNWVNGTALSVLFLTSTRLQFLLSKKFS